MYFSGRFPIPARACTLFFLAAFAFAGPLKAASGVTLAWNPNPEPDIAGYKVYLGNSSRNYTSVVDAGNTTSRILLNLVPGTTYYFAATAYNTTGLESDFSLELVHTVPNLNTAPVISDISDTNMPANGSLTVSFTVHDAETPADSLSLNATSSDPVLMPESNIILGGNGDTRTVTLTPEVDQSGMTTITIIVSDASLSASASFTLNVGVPPTALVAAYSFDALNGTILKDLAGNNNGVINGAVWAATGRFGGALAFDGSNDVVTVGDAASLDLSAGMTIEAWVFPTAQNAGVWRSVLVKENEAGGVYNLYADTDTGVPAVSTVRRNGSFNELRGTIPVAANMWTHLAATYDKTTLRLFVNGIEVSSDALRGPLLASLGPLRIGGNSIRGEYFQGMIDEVRIYNRALSPAEIQADMGEPLGALGLLAVADSDPSVLLDPATENALSEVADPSATTEVPFTPDMIMVGDTHLLRLTWESIPGATYRIVGKTDPLEPNWLNISGDILAEGSVTSWVNPDTTALATIYRVLLVE